MASPGVYLDDFQMGRGDESLVDLVYWYYVWWGDGVLLYPAPSVKVICTHTRLKGKGRH